MMSTLEITVLIVKKHKVDSHLVDDGIQSVSFTFDFSLLNTANVRHNIIKTPRLVVVVFSV